MNLGKEFQQVFLEFYVWDLSNSKAFWIEKKPLTYNWNAWKKFK